jgi:hypothetical protein
MEIKTNIKFNIRMLIKCPKCGEKFDKPECDTFSLICPKCGSNLKIGGGAMDDAMKEAEAKAAGTLDGMGIPLPQQYADIAKAKKLTRPLNSIAVFATLWAVFFPVPYVAAVTACALIPVAAILVMAYLKGRINFETTRKKSETPYLTLALAAPPAAIALRALYDFHIADFDAVWLPVALVGALFSVLIFMYSADMRKKPLYLLVALIFGLMYAYGVVIEVNCLKDRSQPKTCTARVLDKCISSSSRSHTYYIKVTPWGARAAAEEISIAKSLFDRISVKDEIAIRLKEGYLGIPWFTLQRE